MIDLLTVSVFRVYLMTGINTVFLFIRSLFCIQYKIHTTVVYIKLLSSKKRDVSERRFERISKS